jgi:ornithine cyclodeaminase
MSGVMRVLDGPTLRALAPAEDVIAWMRQAMTLVSAGETVMPLRQVHAYGEAVGALGIMHGFAGGTLASVGVKLIGFAPPEKRRGSTHQGLVILYDSDGLAPVALLDAGVVTAIRTAAATALATDVLARADASTLTILGAGEQARAHLDALSRVRTFRRVRVWARDARKAEAMLRDWPAPGGSPVEVLDSVALATRDADVICTVTSAKEPILSAADVSSGAHVNLVGSSSPAASEVEAAFLALGPVFVDSLASATAQASEFNAQRAAGVPIPPLIRGELGAVLAGRIAGRQSESEVTIYKSLGVIAQDIALARHVFERAAAQGRGEIVRL